MDSAHGHEKACGTHQLHVAVVKRGDDDWKKDKYDDNEKYDDKKGAYDDYKDKHDDDKGKYYDHKEDKYDDKKGKHDGKDYYRKSFQPSVVRRYRYLGLIASHVAVTARGDKDGKYGKDWHGKDGKYGKDRDWDKYHDKDHKGKKHDKGKKHGKDKEYDGDHY